MVRKRKVIKRIYEKGRETTLAPVKKKLISPKVRKKTTPAKKSPSLNTGIKQAQRILTPGKISGRDRALIENIIVPRPDYNESYELPHRYNNTHLVLLVKDPFWIYAYWEITPDSLNSLKADLGYDLSAHAALILRVYDVSLKDFNGLNANSYFDIDVGYDSSNWYVNLWNDGASYIAEIGLRISNGEFISLTRSNCVQTPRIRYSPRSEQIWMKVNQDDDSQPQAKVYVQSRARDKLKQTDRHFKGNWKYFSLSDNDIRNYYGKLSPALKDIISSRISRQYGKKAHGYTFILEGESDQERKRILSLLPDNFFVKEIMAGASEKVIVVGQNPKHFEASGGASEQLAESPGFRKFFFELNTELIVYGRTEPDALVYWGDKEIKLREDGTFSMRLTLSDGKIPLEFKATSADGQETRKIYTYVERSTNYNL